MAEIANPNLPTFFGDSNAIAVREGEFTNPETSFFNGANLPASCSGGLGICTGEINFKEQDFTKPDPETVQRSSYIGWQSVPGVVVPTGVSIGGGAEPPSTGPNSLTAHIEAVGTVAPGALIAIVDAFDFLNLTDKTLEAGDIAWGVAANP